MRPTDIPTPKETHPGDLPQPTPRTLPARVRALEAARRITIEVASWPGVEARLCRCGVLGFTYAGRTIGYLHGNSEARFRFPPAVRAALVRAGRVERPPLAPPDLAVRRIRSEADIGEVLRLLSLNYERIARWSRLGSWADGAARAGRSATMPRRGWCGRGARRGSATANG